jgi:prepilin-type N-terminal cleavage/methylation domain-containing protein
MSGRRSSEESSIMKAILTRAHRAVTLTELLVVLAIISLLATIAVPVFVQKTEQARRATARMEVREIANAQEIVALTHGFYVPLHFLDNQADLPSGVGDSDPRDDFDNYPNLNNINVINPLISIRDQDGNQDSLNSNDDRVEDMISYWSGPFLNPTRVYTGDRGLNDPADLTQTELSYDLILDPWGRPYRFYSPLGVIATSTTTDMRSQPSSAGSAYQLDDGTLSVADDRFDTYAIVSYGANGQSDSATTLDDDILYQFGFEINESAFNAF